MVGFRYLVQSNARRVVAERARLTSSPSLVDDLVNGLNHSLGAVAAPSSAHGSVPVTREMVHILSVVAPQASVARREKSVHAVWSTTSTDRAAVPTTDVLTFVDALTQQTSSFSLPCLLELFQIMVRVDHNLTATTGQADATLLAMRDMLQKRLLDAIFEWLPAPNRKLKGDTEAGLCEPLPAGVASRYQTTNQLRKQREQASAEWQGGGSVPEWRPSGSSSSGMTRDELMMTVCTVASRTRTRAPVVGAHSTRPVPGSGHIVSADQATKLTDCLRRFRLVKDFRRVAMTRPIEPLEWNFFMSLLTSPVTAWRELASQTLVSVDVPLGTLGARFCAELDPTQALRELKFLSHAAGGRESDSFTLTVLVALLTVRDGDNKVTVSPLVNAMSASQVEGTVNTLQRTQLRWGPNEESARTSGATQQRVDPAICQQTEKLLAALVAQLKTSDDGTTTITPIALFDHQLVLCNTSLQHRHVGSQGPIGTADLRKHVVELLDLAPPALDAIAHTTAVSEVAALSHTLFSLKTFLDKVPVLWESTSQTTNPPPDFALRPQVETLRVPVVEVLSQLAASRVMDAKMLGVAQLITQARLFEYVSNSGAAELAPANDALRSAQRTFALEAVVAALAEPFPAYHPDRTSASDATHTLPLLSNFRRALQRCVDQQVTLEAIERHATMRGVTFDVPRFLQALIARSESNVAGDGRASHSKGHAIPLASQLAPQLLSAAQYALRLGALRSESTLQAVATALRAWTSDDVTIRGMSWETRSLVVSNLWTLYSTAYPHFHVSKASRALGLESMRVAARLSLTRITSPASLPAPLQGVQLSFPFFVHLWRFHGLALSHPLHNSKTTKYLSIVQSCVVKNVVAAERSLSRHSAMSAVPESLWSPLEVLFATWLNQQRAEAVTAIQAAATNLPHLTASDVELILDWNDFITRLTKVTLNVVVECHSLEDTLRQRRVAMVTEQVLALCRMVDGAQPLLLPSVCNRVRRLLLLYFSLDDRAHGTARRDTRLSRTFVACVRPVWRYAALNGNVGQWTARLSDTPHTHSTNSATRDGAVNTNAQDVASPDSEEEAASAAVLLTRRDWVKLLESHEALVTEPALMQDVARQLVEAMSRRPPEPPQVRESSTTTTITTTDPGHDEGDSEWKAYRRDALMILQTFRTMRPSCY